VVHQLTVVAFKWLGKDALKADGKHPERCLLPEHQYRIDSARVFPAMQQLEQDEGFIRGKRHSHFFWHGRRLLPSLAFLGALRALAARLVIPSPSAHPPGSGAGATGQGGAPHRTNDLMALGLLGLPWAGGDGMTRLPPQPPDNLNQAADVHPGTRGPRRRRNYRLSASR
jgi:hypothetical protein